MELILDGNSRATQGMRFIHKTMLQYFDDKISLVNCYGPVQMCVFFLEYDYTPKGYKILIDCERGIFTVEVKDPNNGVFSPWMIYPESNYFHYEDQEADVIHAVSQIHRAIENSELRFLKDDEIRRLAQQKPPTAENRAEAKHHVY
jgi:hypothetical protein